MNAHRQDDVEFLAWVEGIKGEQKTGAWARRSPRRIYTAPDEGEEEFRWVARGDDDSDVPSPKLWEQTGSPAPQSLKTSPVHTHTSQAQVIAGYRQEMMDLVKNVPESAYELSLRDIIELQEEKTPETLEKEKVKEATETLEKEKEKVKEAKPQAKKGRRMRRRRRGGSMDAGVFLLKMFSPLSLGGKKRSKSAGSCGGAGSKVSPKPILGNREKGGPGVEDRDWWNREYVDSSSSIGSTGINSSGSTGSSSSSNSNRSIISSSSRKFTGCYSFFLSPKSKARRI